MTQDILAARSTGKAWYTRKFVAPVVAYLSTESGADNASVKRRTKTSIPSDR